MYNKECLNCQTQGYGVKPKAGVSGVNENNSMSKHPVNQQISNRTEYKQLGQEPVTQRPASALVMSYCICLLDIKQNSPNETFGS
jgi:hypothetical protein